MIKAIIPGARFVMFKCEETIGRTIALEDDSRTKMPLAFVVSLPMTALALCISLAAGCT
ncbi:hypothetical protein PQ459_13635 [Chryseobacterium sp. KACC 21268]|nr:hypothetical protein PQ459_13635 [Chryseobacterium sp. KACC 21268]